MGVFKDSTFLRKVRRHEPCKADVEVCKHVVTTPQQGVDTFPNLCCSLELQALLRLKASYFRKNTRRLYLSGRESQIVSTVAFFR